MTGESFACKFSLRADEARGVTHLIAVWIALGQV